MQPKVLYLLSAAYLVVIHRPYDLCYRNDLFHQIKEFFVNNLSSTYIQPPKYLSVH